MNCIIESGIFIAPFMLAGFVGIANKKRKHSHIIFRTEASLIVSLEAVTLTSYVARAVNIFDARHAEFPVRQNSFIKIEEGGFHM
jgi:hypothetical protein